MNNKQLAERIGNIDEKLIEEAEYMLAFEKQPRRKGFRQLAAAFAVIALMACSFTVGSLAFAHESVVEVKVPVEQEIIEIDEIGLTLILPDSWKDQYAMEKTEFGEYVVYNPDIRKAWEDESGIKGSGGMLFYIMKWDEQLTEKQVRENDGEWNFAMNTYIMTTKDGTYLLYYASDVQCTADTFSLYEQMASEIRDIQFVIGNILDK